MWMPFELPSARERGTTKSAIPLRPAGAPSGRASVAIAPASMLEQNHLEPVSRQTPSDWRAVVVIVPRSEPPLCSVMNMAPSQASSKRSAVSRARRRSRTSGGAKRSTRPTTPLVIPIAHMRPVSAWQRR